MKVIYLEPNHICQNPNCTKGSDGNQKHYYACDYCGWSQNWRSICCSKECYLEMTNIGGKKPVRTDMNSDEVRDMMAKSYDEVMGKTMAELADYKETIEQIGLGQTIDLINEEIDTRHKDE